MLWTMIVDKRVAEKGINVWRTTKRQEINAIIVNLSKKQLHSIQYFKQKKEICVYI